ncbi:MAG: SAM-dependent methyltransferase [Promethearchaeota archaeon]
MRKDKKWIKDRKREEYYRRAKKEHYSSRAAFKLLQIDKKYRVLKSSGMVLDLCCSPGSWMEAIRQRVPRVRVVGIDLQNTRVTLKNALFLKKNILDPDFIDAVLTLVKIKPPCFNLVLSDCAPKFTGAKELDLYRQHELTMRALECCEILLVDGGDCVLKSFQGLNEEGKEVESRLKEMFLKVYKTKPDSSRSSSPEFYFVGKGKIGKTG